LVGSARGDEHIEGRRRINFDVDREVDGLRYTTLVGGDCQHLSPEIGKDGHLGSEEQHHLRRVDGYATRRSKLTILRLE
jgi:hypothetical protein